jgi:hypothetical protein
MPPMRSRWRSAARLHTNHIDTGISTNTITTYKRTILISMDEEILLFGEDGVLEDEIEDGEEEDEKDELDEDEEDEDKDDLGDEEEEELV